MKKWLKYTIVLSIVVLFAVAGYFFGYRPLLEEGSHLCRNRNRYGGTGGCSFRNNYRRFPRNRSSRENRRVSGEIRGKNCGTHYSSNVTILSVPLFCAIVNVPSNCCISIFTKRSPNPPVFSMSKSSGRPLPLSLIDRYILFFFLSM